MKIVSFIEVRDQPDVVERILRHCNLWNPPCRAPPEPVPPEQIELEFLPIGGFRLHSTTLPSIVQEFRKVIPYQCLMAPFEFGDRAALRRPW